MSNFSMDYEVALEILGRSKAPYVNMEWQEEQKEKPNQVLLAFLEAKLIAIDDLMEDMRPEDTELIQAILNPENTIFRG